MTLSPFRGIRFNPDLVSDLSRVMAPPYDVISVGRQQQLYDASPHNIVRVDFGQQQAGDTEGNDRYSRAASTLEAWLKEKVLIQDREPSLYLYEQTFSYAGRSYPRRGFFVTRRIEPLGKRVRPHEKTLSGPKADRLLLMKATAANLSPIFCLYSDPSKQVTTLLAPLYEAKPLYDFVDTDGIREKLWRVTDPKIFQEVDHLFHERDLFIADGHHRYETSITYRDWRRGQERGEGADYVMMFLAEMSDPGLLILPTHRALQNWPDFDAGRFKKYLGDYFDFKTFNPNQKTEFMKSLHQEEGRRAAFGLLFPGDPQFHLITLADRAKSRAEFKTLGDVTPLVDTAVLHELIFRQLLKLNEAAEKELRYLLYIKDTEEAIQKQADPSVNCVFLVNAIPMEVLKKVSSAGLVLPPKTTFFYPKLLTGLVMNRLE
ncbi:MAG: DUF1015 domain-containing protein [Deltaproteobacteria bacterium]|nr:DUF1015 domain-containing protein [Deltaproteobacteria bacterium]